MLIKFDEAASYKVLTTFTQAKWPKLHLYRTSSVYIQTVIMCCDLQYPSFQAENPPLEMFTVLYCLNILTNNSLMFFLANTAN